LWGTSDYKGPSVRAEFAQADRVNQKHQGILDDKVLSKVASAVILDAIANSEIPPPPRINGETAERAIMRATRGSFRFPPRLTIDVGRETQARLAELSMGITSPQEIAAEDGKDAYVRATEKADFAEFVKAEAERRGIPESAIFLPAGQQLPNTPAMAAAVGEHTGEEAAAAQADSAQKAPETQQPQEELSDDRVVIAFDNGGYIPTQAMARNAKRALEVRESKPPSQRGMTAVGLARARDISNRRELPLETVKRMKSYFDRHAVDKEGETWGEQGKGWQAWNGWGGDEGRTWAEAIVKREEAKTDASLRSDSVQMAEREVVQWLQRPTRAVPQDIIADDAVRTAFAGYTEAVDGYRLNLHGRLEEELKNAKRN
jgi:hypothetical protein